MTINSVKIDDNSFEGQRLPKRQRHRVKSAAVDLDNPLSQNTVSYFRQIAGDNRLSPEEDALLKSQSASTLSIFNTPGLKWFGKKKVKNIEKYKTAFRFPIIDKMWYYEHGTEDRADIEEFYFVSRDLTFKVSKPAYLSMKGELVFVVVFYDKAFHAVEVCGIPTLLR